MKTIDPHGEYESLSRERILTAAIVKYGTIAQMEMAIEEMSELTKAICKYKRALGAGNVTPDIEANIIEEMADVQIMLDQMKLIFGPCWDEENKKLARLAQMMGL